jgi:hypothetical protein
LLSTWRHRVDSRERDTKRRQHREHMRAEPAAERLHDCILPLSSGRTQLVLTHDFAVREPIGGLVAGQFLPEDADAILCGAVERNSHRDLTAVKQEAERRAAMVRT